MSAIHTRYGRGFYGGLLEALIRVMGSAKGYLFHHGPRVAVLSHRLGRSFGLSHRQLAELFFGSILSDLGMIGLVEEAWENPVPVLPPDSRAQVERHPQRSADTVLSVPYLESVAPLVQHHHEWWDGSGYPDGLQGDDIPFGAQILRVADTAAALGEERPHRQALTPDEIRRVVAQDLGREFGPEVGRRFILLHDRDELFGYHEGYFRRIQQDAMEALLPEDVSPLSADQLLEIFGGLIDAKDRYTGGHSRRVANLAHSVARIMGLGEDFRLSLRAAGYLHDLGKLNVPLRVLMKQGKLDDQERGEIQRHAPAGATILQAIPSLQHLAPGARYHHERWDGSGYPEGLSGQRIPRVAQILAVCDAYDAMTSSRAYRPARTHELAIEEIERSAGSHFAPQVAEAFLSLSQDTFDEIRNGDRPGPRKELFSNFRSLWADARSEQSALPG